MKKNTVWTSNLDELQEQQLLRIEHRGCWLAFWGLLAAMVIESLLYRGEMPGIVAGEFTVFMVLALYIFIACIRRGIWDRKLKMDLPTILALSAIGGLASGAFNFVMVYTSYPDKLAGAVSAAIILAAFCFALVFIVLIIGARITKKRMDKLNEEPSED